MISWTEIISRLFLAAVLGAVIGVEREKKDWAAGLRTHMMVCVGSALIMIVSAFGFSDVLGTPNVVLDPSRIAAQVVSGIGFIGAGAIIFLKQGAIRGLTTAAGLWTVAAIDLATGGGMYLAASTATTIALIILWGIKLLENRFFDKYKQTSIKVVTRDSNKSMNIINEIFQNNKLEISDCSINKANKDFEISFRFTGLNPIQLTTVINELQVDPNISEVVWNN